MRRNLLLIGMLVLCTQLLASPEGNISQHRHGSVEGTSQASFYQNNKMNFYNLKYLFLDIKVETQSNAIAGTATYNALVTQTLDTFAIEYKANMLLDSVLVNGTKRSYVRFNDHIYIPFSPSVPAGTMLTVSYFFKGTALNGIAFGTDPATGLKFTANVSESYQAREWFPSKQLLNDKIDSSTVVITTDAANKAGSNGLLQLVENLPNNKVRYTWKTNYPINYYLTSFAVGNYLEYKNYAKPAAIAPDSVLIQHYIVNNASFFNSIKANLDMTPRFIEKLSELFGVYPFHKEKYGHAHAMIGGGMEHQTMSTMQSFGSSLIAHELGHQWFGDNVTCGTWNDIWVNEGFATYADYLMSESFPLYYSLTAATIMANYHTSIMGQPGGSVFGPIADSHNEGRIFSSRLSYNKGAAILHTLRFEMQSDTLFFKTLRNYQQKFKDTFATAADFKLVAEQTTGRNFTNFFNQWYYGEGYPTYNVVFGPQGTDTLVIDVSQTTSMPSITPFFSGLLELKIKSAQGDTTIVVNHTTNNRRLKIPYSKIAATVEVDPKNWIINKVGTIVTGIQNIPAATAGVNIYPNPTRGLLNIKLPAHTFREVTITDVAGRVVQRYPVSSSATKVMANLAVPGGVYFVQLNGSKGRVVQKIIVDK